MIVVEMVDHMVGMVNGRGVHTRGGSKVKHVGNHKLNSVCPSVCK